MKSYLDYNREIKNISDLPKYPIQNMEDTFDRFLEWLEPLITKEEYKEVEGLVEEFIKSDDSKKIDEKMKELGNRENDSWIFDYWVKFHLEVRGPLVPHTNVPIIYEHPEIKEFSVTEKAASLIYGISKVYADFRENNSGDYYVGKKRFSTDQFHGALGAINHIARGTDTYYINSDFSTNVVVLYKNNIYSLESIKENKEVNNLNEIHNTLKEIYDGEISPIMPNVNFVTGEPDRDLAGDYLLEILKDPNNKENYEKIKDAIFVLNLDEDSPKTDLDELYCASMDTTYFNRWHGKGVEFSISKNGVISFNVDHCFCDGGTEVYLIDQMSKFLNDLKFTDESGKVEFEELEFTIDKDMSLKLKKSFEDFKEVMNSFEARYVEFEGLSRERLRDNGILSGDGFIHIAMQAAQMMTYKEVHNTYISVDARTFFKGRTEANRPVTLESLRFIEELLNPTKDKSEQKSMMLDALDEHYKRTKLCQAGNGVNRYLHVVEEIIKDFKEELGIEKTPELFKNDNYKLIHSNRLSTTSFGHENIKYIYFPPVTEKGLGIYYMVGNSEEDKSFMYITAFNDYVEMMDEFNSNLKKAVDKMLKIISVEI